MQTNHYIIKKETEVYKISHQNLSLKDNSSNIEFQLQELPSWLSSFFKPNGNKIPLNEFYVISIKEDIGTFS
jgi:hypothetical protein